MSMVETAPSKIQVRNLNFYYGKFHALKNINLDIAKNQVTAFIGPSGCGKSTLLRTFNKMFEFTSNFINTIFFKFTKPFSNKFIKLCFNR